MKVVFTRYMFDGPTILSRCTLEVSKRRYPALLINYYVGQKTRLFLHGDWAKIRRFVELNCNFFPSESDETGDDHGTIMITKGNALGKCPFPIASKIDFTTYSPAVLDWLEELVG